MKKYLVITLSALLLVSCNDGFLDRQPLDSVSDEAVFNNAGLSEAYVNALYTSLPDPMQEGNISCITDEAFFRYGGSSTRYMADGTVTPSSVVYISDGGTAHDSRTTILNIWNRAYNRIRKMNTFLKRMEDSEIEASVKTRLTGEVHFLRAWMYTNLIQRYGGVPIIKDVYALGDDYTVSRSTFDDCVAFIKEDLDAAESMLPTKDDAVLGRANKDIVLALRSRLTLFVASPLFNDPDNPENNLFHGAYSAKKWQDAFDAAKAVVDRAEAGAYRLADTYDGYWTDVNCPEVIWAKYYTTTNGNKAQLLYPPENGGIGGYESMNPTENLIIDYEMTNGKKFFEEGSGYDPEHPWDNRDPRLYKTIILNFRPFRDIPSFEYCLYYQPGVYTVDDTPANRSKYPGADVDDANKKLRPYPNGYTRADFAAGKETPDHTAKSQYMWDAVTTTGYGVNKWHIPTSPITTQVNYSLMFPWFRLAEFYLNYAEAAYMLGKEDITRTYINKIRDRKDVLMPHVTESGTNLWDRLVNERRIEFALENQRFFDTRRWKIAPKYEDTPWLSSRTMVLQAGSYTKNEKGSIVPNVTSQDTLYRVAVGLDYHPVTKMSYHRDKYNHTYSKSERSLVFEYKWLGKTYRIDYGDCLTGLAPTEKAWDDKMYLQPIPSTEMERTNGQLVQNPGY